LKENAREVLGKANDTDVPSSVYRRLESSISRKGERRQIQEKVQLQTRLTQGVFESIVLKVSPSCRKACGGEKDIRAVERPKSRKCSGRGSARG